MSSHWPRHHSNEALSPVNIVSSQIHRGGVSVFSIVWEGMICGMTCVCSDERLDGGTRPYLGDDGGPGLESLQSALQLRRVLGLGLPRAVRHVLRRRRGRRGGQQGEEHVRRHLWSRVTRHVSRYSRACLGKNRSDGLRRRNPHVSLSAFLHFV